MAIRLRMIGDEGVALCAAKSKPELGDIYINDFWHYALGMKFGVDSGEFTREDGKDEPIIRLMLEEEAKCDRRRNETK